MSHNDAEDFALRLYSRVPAHYRVYDEQQGLPLLALLTVVGEQVANVRQDLDALWDNFFIETSEDWVVPYIGSLVGTNLLAHPVDQSNRLEVCNTVIWRRSKGTPAMLRALGQAISGWPVDLAEFFQNLGWSQNMNHLRLDRPLMPNLRDPYRLSRLGHADDPFAHAADVKPARQLDQPRITPESPEIGRVAWGTPGRYQIKNLGLFVRRLQTFALQGVTPAAAQPGEAAPANAACFTFDPLFREAPLFVKQTGEPLSRAAFNHAPWETFGTDIGVRQFGVLLASDAPPSSVTTNSRSPWASGNAGSGLSLHPTEGLRLMEPRDFQQGGVHFVISAEWQNGNPPTELGAVSTLFAAQNRPNAYLPAYLPGSAVAGQGQLIVTVRTGQAALGWANLPPSPAGRFPGAVLALRLAETGPLHTSDGLYIYLPAAKVTPDEPLTLFIADDGSAYTEADMNPLSLARPAEEQVYPARMLTSSTAPANQFTVLNRKPGGLRLADPARFGAAPAQVLIEVGVFTGTFQALGAIATVDQDPANYVGQNAADYPDLDIAANPWPAFRYAPSQGAVQDNLPPADLLYIWLRPLPREMLVPFIPAAELIVTNRVGKSLLVYLPERVQVGADGVKLFVADDGSTYVVPADPAARMSLSNDKEPSFSGLTLARASAGQVLPIPGVWPLRQRQPVALNLCRCERNSLLRFGELGIDPELGGFAFAPADPLLTASNIGDPPAWPKSLSVDYVEAVSYTHLTLPTNREV